MPAQQRAPEIPVQTDVCVLLIPPHKVIVPNEIWRVCRFIEGEFKEEDLVPHIVFQTGCYSIYVPLPGSTIPYYQIGARGRISFDAEGMVISGTTPCRERNNSTEVTEIQIRYNTENIKDSRVKPWRFRFMRQGKFCELWIESFKINGRCYTTLDHLIEDGVEIEKWHISCVGEFLLRGTHVEITSY